MDTPRIVLESGKEFRSGDSPDGLSLDGYHILRALGEGGMAAVFLAYDVDSKKRVAIKILSDSMAQDKVNVDRFYREARIGSALQHPHLVRTLRFGRDADTGRHAMVMEYIDGPSCEYILSRDGRMTVDDATLVIYHVSKALAFLHSQSVIHRDVKPDNILLGTDGIAKLADFGLAKRLGGVEDVTTMSTGVGSMWYMPLEQARNAACVDQRSDLFALGATFYHMLTGQVPFPGDSHAEVVAKKLAGQYVPASKLNRQVPASIDHILCRLLATDPRKRFATALDLMIELERSSLLNGYRTVVAVGPVESVEPRISAGATRADLKFPDAVPDTPLEDAPWRLRIRDEETGRVYSREATTAQVLAGLRNGLWPQDVQAARGEREVYRPVIDYPEFRVHAPVAINDKLTACDSRRTCRWIMILAAFGVGLLAAASLVSLYRSIMSDPPHAAMMTSVGRDSR
jgi:serine/threonine-protein kinase